MRIAHTMAAPTEQQRRCTIIKVIFGLIGLSLVTTFCYWTRHGLFEETHKKIYYTSTKRLNSTCLVVKREVIVLPNITDSLPQGETNPEGIDLEGLPDLLNKFKPGKGSFFDAVELQDNSLLLYHVEPQQEETREVQVNWIQVDGESPKWYFTQLCVIKKNLTFWVEKVVRPAPEQQHHCQRLLPINETFWAKLNFTCEPPKPEKQDSQENEDPGPRPEPTKKQRIMPARLTGVSSAAQNRTKACIQCKAMQLDPCMWSMGPIACEGTPYLPLSLTDERTHGRGASPPSSGEIYIDDWLNETLSWVWRRKVTHFRLGGATEKTVNRVMGPHHSWMYVQKIPKPEDLWSVPKGDFAKIDKCAVQKMYEGLHNKDYEFETTKSYAWASPRCDIWQVDAWSSGYWTYNCTKQLKKGTLKGVLEQWPLVWMGPDTRRTEGLGVPMPKADKELLGEVSICGYCLFGSGWNRRLVRVDRTETWGDYVATSMENEA